MSVLVYLASIDHWAIEGEAEVDAIPWIGRLLLAEDERAQSVGALGAQLNRLFHGEAETAALLLANTISKLLDARHTGTLEGALLLASRHLSPSSWPLYTAGILRALRHREPAVRKRAWSAAGRLQGHDQHFKDTLRGAWEQLVVGEGRVEVLTAMCGFFAALEGDEEFGPLILAWIHHVQRALILRPFPLLQCRILGLCRVFKCVDTEILVSLLASDSPSYLVLEVARSLPTGLDPESPLPSHIIKHVRAQLKDPASVPQGLVLAETLARPAPKILLHLQSELLAELESEDIQMRILALRVLVHAANQDNYQILLSHVRTAIGLALPCESEAVMELLKLGQCFISVSADGSLSEFLALLDLLPESIGEGHVARLVAMIPPSQSMAMLTRDYLCAQGHSLAHDLVATRLIAERLEPALACRLLCERTRASEQDPWHRHFLLQAHFTVMERGAGPTERMKVIFAAWMKDEWDVGMRLQLKRLLGLDPEDLPSELAERFTRDLLTPKETPAQPSPAQPPPPPKALDILDTVPFPASDPSADPSPSPTSSLAITSDLFKGLL